MLKKGILLLVLFSMIGYANAQDDKKGTEADCKAGWDNGWCWGEDPTTAKEKNALYNDAMKMNNFEEAATHLEWLLTNTPNLNKAIYINGTKIYLGLVKKVKGDEAKTIEYQDKVLALHDARITYFGERSSVLARKGAYVYSYLKKRKDKDYNLDMIELYEEIFKLNGKKTSRSNLTFLMVISVGLRGKAKAVELTLENYESKKEEALKENNEGLAKAYDKKIAEYKEKDKYKEYQEKYERFSEDWMIGIYESITETLEYQVGNTTGDKQGKWVSTQDMIDGLFPKVVDIDCDFVREKMGDDLRSNPDDLKLAKRAV